MSPVVRQRLPVAGPHFHGALTPQLQMLNTIGRPAWASVTKFRILHFWIKALGVAPIYFDVIHSPRCVSLGILQFVVQTTGTLLTGEGAGIGINAQFQSLAVYVAGKSFDAGGKSGCIGNDVSLGITADLPAIIDVDVLVAGGLHAGAHHCVGGFTDQLLAYITGEFIPTIPAHRRSLCQLRRRTVCRLCDCGTTCYGDWRCEENCNKGASNDLHFALPLFFPRGLSNAHRSLSSQFGLVNS